MALKLFLEYINEQQEAVSQTWTEVRDTLQMKRPFAILVFRTKSSYLQYLEDTKESQNQIKQVAMLEKEGKLLKYPSIFIILTSDQDYSDEVRRLNNKYDIKEIIAGQANIEYAKLYLPDGSSSEMGNEIITTLSPDEFQNDECFKVGSTYYKFADIQT